MITRLRAGELSLRYHRRTMVVIALSGAALVILVHLTLSAGQLSGREVWDGIIGRGDVSVVRSVQSRRLPRVLTAIGVGAALGVSGAVFQSVSRNVLASPDIIGFTTGAATAAAVQIIYFNGGVVETGLAAILGGLFTAVFVYTMARQGGSTGGLRLILVGIGTGAFVGAVRDFLMVRADITDASVVQLWSAGSLSGRGWEHAALILGVCLLLVPVLGLMAGKLFLIEMGDDVAGGLGVAVEMTRFAAIILAVLLVGVATAVAGPISFIALAAPQIARRLTRAPGVPVGASASIGAIVLTAADHLAQHVDIGLRTPVGLVTSLLGGLYLLWLLRREK
ncbi:FecCD family ABC transporter permease [Corynebacterium pacaense]|uniref:FecCD family ABC transporter permease n=1 Tax=Corynebacterium pacaense TaxID=1816684 RepID=UPI001FE2883E|nr:iron chelate uptake ABC transporter family permease subunit [Corynebacterium pacaense]